MLGTSHHLNSVMMLVKSERHSTALDLEYTVDKQGGREGGS